MRALPRALWFTRAWISSGLAGLSCLLISCAGPRTETVAQQEAKPQDGMPYVYTQWEQFTTADGLPNDHIFAVKVYGDDVWIGTEGGLACLNKRTRKQTKQGMGNFG